MSQIDYAKVPDVSNNEWVYPVRRDYKFVCCDCGLVHAIDFDVVLAAPSGKKSKAGNDLCQIYTVPNLFSVRFRCRRDNRNTKGMREYKNGNGIPKNKKSK